MVVGVTWFVGNFYANFLVYFYGSLVVYSVISNDLENWRLYRKTPETYPTSGWSGGY